MLNFIGYINLKFTFNLLNCCDGLTEGTFRFSLNLFRDLITNSSVYSHSAMTSVEVENPTNCVFMAGKCNCLGFNS